MAAARAEVQASSPEAVWQLDRFCGAVQLAPSTLAVYRRDLLDLARWCVGRELPNPTTVTRHELRRYLAALTARGLAPATVARKVAAARRYFAWALHQGLVAADPTVGLSAPSGPARLPRVLRADELSADDEEEENRRDDFAPRRTPQTARAPADGPSHARWGRPRC